jgi:predicted transcriptional regulator YdeE
MLLGGLRRKHRFAEVVNAVPEQWRQFRSSGAVPGRLGNRAYGVICGADADTVEYLCGVEVGSFTGLPQDLGRMRIDERYYAVFPHRGHVSSLKATWEGVFEWLENSREYESAQRPDFEVYDETFDSRTGLGGVEIWIAVSARKLKAVDG